MTYRIPLPDGRMAEIEDEYIAYWQETERRLGEVRDMLQAHYDRTARVLGPDLDELSRKVFALAERDPTLHDVELGIVRELASHTLRCPDCADAFCSSYNNLVSALLGLILAFALDACRSDVERIVGKAARLIPEDVARSLAVWFAYTAVAMYAASPVYFATHAAVNAARRALQKNGGPPEVAFDDIPGPGRLIPRDPAEVLRTSSGTRKEEAHDPRR